MSSAKLWSDLGIGRWELAIGIVLVSSVVVVAIPAISHLREVPPPPTPAVRFAFLTPPDLDLGFGDEPLDAAISPDETQVVFVATTGGVPRLWRRLLTAEDTVVLPGTEGAQLPSWKASGRTIAFFANGRVKALALDSGDISDLADAQGPGGATWLADGSLLFAGSGHPSIRRLSNGTLSDATVIRTGDRSHSFPMSAGGSAFIYLATLDNGRRVLRLVDGAGERELTATSGHGQLIDDYVVYARDGVLLGQRFDPATKSLVGRSTPIATKVGVTAGGRSLFAASSRILLCAGDGTRARALTWIDLTGQRLGTAGDPADYWQVRLSPDDQFAAVTMVDPLLRTLDIFLLPTTGATTLRKLTLALEADTDPVWSPDSTRVLFRSLQGGGPNLFTRGIEVGISIEPLLRSELDETPTDWSSSGEVLFHAARAGGSIDLWSADPSTRRLTGMATGSFNETDGRWSPGDGDLAFVSDESGQPDVYVGTGDRRLRVSSAGGTKPRWSRDGRALFFLRGSQIMRAEREGEGFTAARPVFDAPGIRDFDVAAQSDRLIVLLPASSAPTPVVSTLTDWRTMLAGAR